MKKRLLIAGAVSLLLAGCSNTSSTDYSALEASIQALSNKVDGLSGQVSALEAEQNALKSEQASLKSEQSAISSDIRAAQMASDEAASEAMRANERINNIASSYTK